jgi:hypothetical protein
MIKRHAKNDSFLEYSYRILDEHIYIMTMMNNGNLKIEINEDLAEHVETRKSTIMTDNITLTTNTTEQLVILTLPPSSSTIPRDLWTNKIEFLLSVIGYVVDLGKDKKKTKRSSF